MTQQGFNRYTLSQWLLPLLPASLIVSKRLNVLLIGLYGLSVLIQPELGRRLVEMVKKPWIWAFIGFYLWHVLSLAWSDNTEMAFFALEKKASLVLIPCFIGLDKRIDFVGFQQCMLSLILSCCFFIWICLFLAFSNYLDSGEASFFFYHAFSWPLDELNAIYFSFYTFTGLAFGHYLAKKKYSLLSSYRWQGFIFFSLSMGLVLLSSRLFIVLTLLFLLRLAVLNYAQIVSRKLRLGGLAMVGLFMAGVLFFSQIRDRFDQLLDSNFEVLQQDQFEYDTAFNGLTIRLLFWRFAGEIVTEQKAYLFGTGIGDVQDAMNETIIKHNVYHGNPQLGDHGFLGYNFHNQFVETWVQLGFIGVILWLLLLRQGISLKVFDWSHPYLYLMLAILAFSMIESLLERQHGIVFFALFVSIFQTTLKYEVPQKPFT